HTTTGCGKQGFPSAQPYLSHTPGANPFCCMFLSILRFLPPPSWLFFLILFTIKVSDKKKLERITAACQTRDDEIQ
ncbi:hypothetical protein BO94DRAFT_468590, partial [Aspergillus sclerotioniger CBS 115572]